MKLRALRSTLPTLGQALRPVPTLSEQRISGSKLQARRLKMWSADPHCAHCGRVVEYPQGFELDHKVRLEDGGPDTEANCQILCVYTEAGLKLGCHAEKTRKENA